MSISCWKSIGSHSLLHSPTLLTAFNSHSHRPNGIVPNLPICVGDKNVNVEVEIVDENLDYNLLLGRNWIYEMDAIASSLFRILCFTHKGRIVTVDQMDCSPIDPNTSANSTVPLVNDSKQPIENLRVGM